MKSLIFTYWGLKTAYLKQYILVEHSVITLFCSHLAFIKNKQIKTTHTHIKKDNLIRTNKANIRELTADGLMKGRFLFYLTKNAGSCEKIYRQIGTNNIVQHEWS